MTDQHTSHLISEYIDNELSPDLRSKFDKHIEKCQRCREELGKSIRLKTVLSEINAPDPGDQYFDDLSERIESLTFHEGAASVESVVPTGRFGKQQEVLKMLIRLAAVITLLFVSFYISDMAGSSRNERWVGTMSDSDYVENDNLRYSEEPSRTQAGISRTSARNQNEADSGETNRGE